MTCGPPASISGGPFGCVSCGLAFFPGSGAVLVPPTADSYAGGLSRGKGFPDCIVDSEVVGISTIMADGRRVIYLVEERKTDVAVWV